MNNNKNSTRYYSHKQESSVAKMVNGKLTSNSGATPFYKGDVISDNVMYECKTSMKPVNSYSVKKSVLDILQTEVIGSRYEAGVLVFNFGPNTQNYYVLDERFYKELIDIRKENI